MDGQFSNVQGASLDLTFIIDCTGSMGSYIASATANIELICEEIVKSERLQSAESLRLAIVAYRDHPPQDVSYVTKLRPFTSDVSEVKEFLKSLYASGGGDGPEAVTAGMAEALNLDWRPEASKVCLLIADAPCHGIGEYGDGFSQGSPDGNDPLQIVRQMASRGIAFFMVACEPALSQYSYATDFFRALAQLSAGSMLPLTAADLLAKVIVGSALEHMDLDRLIQQIGPEVAARIHTGQESVDDVAVALHKALQFQNTSTKQLIIDDIYRDSEEARHNVQVWMNAPDLASAKPLLKKVTGSRFTDKYLESRYGSRSVYRGAPAVPARPTRSSSPPLSASPPPATSGSPGSPSRKVAANFASFAAPTMSLESTPVTQAKATKSIFGSVAPAAPRAGSGVGLGSAFGSMRGGSSGMDDDMDDDEQTGSGAASTMDDDEDDDTGEGVKFRKGAISLEQAKRIAMQSAWRGMRA